MLPSANSGQEVQCRAARRGCNAYILKLSQDGSWSLRNGADLNGSGAWHYPLKRLVTLHGNVSALDLCIAPNAPDITSESFAGSEPLNRKAAFQLAFSFGTSSGSFPTNMVSQAFAKSIQS